MNRPTWQRVGIFLAAAWVAALAASDLRAGTSKVNEEQIEAALAQTSTANFQQIPLAEVVAFFCDFHVIEIQLDRPALEELGLDDREPITVWADGIPLESILGLILEPHGLTWTIRHDMLTITSCAAARKVISTRIYQIDDLLRGSDLPRGRARDGYGPYGGATGAVYGSTMGDSSLWPTELLHTITTTIEPQSWSEEGPGRASVLSIGGRPLLVVRQDYRTHRMIERFLEALRELDGEKPKAAEAPKTSAKPSSHRPPPPVAEVRPPQTHPAADPFGAPLPAKTKPSEGKPSSAHPASDNPFDDDLPAPVADPFGAPPSVKSKPSEDKPSPAHPASDNPFDDNSPAQVADPFGA